MSATSKALIVGATVMGNAIVMAEQSGLLDQLKPKARHSQVFELYHATGCLA